MAADPVRRRRGRPPKNAPRNDEPAEIDFELAPEEEFFRDGEDLGADLRRMQLAAGSAVYAIRRSL